MAPGRAVPPVLRALRQPSRKAGPRRARCEGLNARAVGVGGRASRQSGSCLVRRRLPGIPVRHFSGPTLRSVPTLSVTRSFLPALHLGASGNPTSPPPTPRQSPGPQGAGAEGPCGAQALTSDFSVRPHCPLR